MPLRFRNVSVIRFRNDFNMQFPPRRKPNKLSECFRWRPIHIDHTNLISDAQITSSAHGTDNTRSATGIIMVMMQVRIAMVARGQGSCEDGSECGW